MLQAVYQALYSSALNPLVRGFCKNVLGGEVEIPPSGIMRFTTSQGKEVVLDTNQTCHVTKVVYYHGYQNYEYSEFFLKLIAEAKTFFDVGANIGYYAMLAAKHNPGIQVYAFDPSPGPFHYLKRNIALNGLEGRVHAYDLALSDSNGQVTFSIAATPKYKYLKFNTLGGGGHISEVRDSNLTMKLDVRTQTLDAFVAEHNITSLDLMKMDAENAEHLILQGGMQTIGRFRPVIITEVFSAEMAQLIETRIANDNYLLFDLDGNQPKRIQRLTQDLGQGISNVLLVPQERAEALGLM